MKRIQSTKDFIRSMDMPNLRSMSVNKREEPELEIADMAKSVTDEFVQEKRFWAYKEEAMKTRFKDFMSDISQNVEVARQSFDSIRMTRDRSCTIVNSLDTANDHQYLMNKQINDMASQNRFNIRFASSNKSKVRLIKDEQMQTDFKNLIKNLDRAQGIHVPDSARTIQTQKKQEQVAKFKKRKTAKIMLTHVQSNLACISKLAKARRSAPNLTGEDLKKFDVKKIRNLKVSGQMRAKKIINKKVLKNSSKNDDNQPKF